MNGTEGARVFMVNEIPRHLINAKINVITESKKYTVLSETFSAFDMKVKYSLPQEFLNQKTPIIFQIVYSSEVKSYIFNVYGTVKSESPTTVTFTQESLSVIQQFVAEVGSKKKAVVV